jgi:hypothetical protein
MDLDKITLASFNEVYDRSACDGDGKKAFRSLIAALESLPETQERLAFEMLREAERCLDEKVEPLAKLFFVRSWTNAISPKRRGDMLAILRRIAVRYFDIVQDIQPNDLSITLPTVIAISRTFDIRLTEDIVNELCQRSELLDGNDYRRKVLTEILQSS